MRKPIIYLPLEKYKSRYSEYVCGVNGIFHTQAIETGRCDVHIIAPENHATVFEIKHGTVIDYTQRAKWGFFQVLTLLDMIANDMITDESVIYIEDFWLPGFEMIPYACQLKGIRPKVFATCYAQTFDPHDFTYPMRTWMRPIEIGWINWLTGIFVACEDHKQQMLDTLHYGAYVDKIHSVGLMMKRSHLLAVFPGLPKSDGLKDRYRNVVFASRLDKEKNPQFFIDLARAYYKIDPTVVFTFAWPAAEQMVLKAQQEVQNGKDNLNLRCADVRSKSQYFELLARSRVSFNCADQDYVSYTMLEALAYGMLPLYTNARPSFVATLRGHADFLYEHLTINDACFRLQRLFVERKAKSVYTISDFTPCLYDDFAAVYEQTVARMLDVMLAEPQLSTLLGI